MISKHLKELRKELRLTQQEFADSLGIKRNTVATYETGKSNPSDSAVVLICTKFNVNEEWLRNGTGEMFKASPSSALDKLAEERGLDHGTYVAIEKFLNLKPEIRSSLISYFKEVAAAIDDIDANVPAFPQGVPNVALAEAAYEKSLGIVPNRESTVSNTIEDTERNAGSNAG